MMLWKEQQLRVLLVKERSCTEILHYYNCFFVFRFIFPHSCNYTQKIWRCCRCDLRKKIWGSEKGVEKKLVKEMLSHLKKKSTLGRKDQNVLHWNQTNQQISGISTTILAVCQLLVTFQNTQNSHNISLRIYAQCYYNPLHDSKKGA